MCGKELFKGLSFSTAVEKLWTETVEKKDGGDSGHKQRYHPQENHSPLHSNFSFKTVFLALIPTGHRPY